MGARAVEGREGRARSGRSLPAGAVPARRRAALRVALVLLTGVMAACDTTRGGPALAGARDEAPPDADPAMPLQGGRGYEIPRLPPERLRLTGAATGMDDLLRTVERALAERDSIQLQELLVNAREFRDILFPAFPAAHPPINAEFEDVWPLHITDAMEGLRLLLREYGGKRVHIVAVRFEHPDQDFVNFVLDETSHVDIDVNGERREDVRLFGSVYHVGDQYKVLSYPD